MKRIIVDFKKLTPEILSLLIEKYPDGYDDRHIIVFKNAINQTIEAVEVPTEDCMYLVKVSSSLVNTMVNFDLDDYNYDEFNELITELPDKLPFEEDD
ncbi:MAG: hypothetical protein E2O87_02410 [Bacteroidetes bacterium]|nr:MAG: hypothetical protein E2O87_02410 [Bacteroidota bacterium]